jgi:solute carrier family 39 (zinc transporter), member 11
MIAGYSRLVQALLGTGFGWFMTALGAAMVWPLEALGTTPERQRLFLDAALGASAGIMLAASYWSLLAPAIEEAEALWPDRPNANWVVATVGFLLGGLVMVAAEEYLPDDVVASMAPSNLGAVEAEPGSVTEDSGEQHDEDAAPPRKRRSSRRRRSTSKPAASSSRKMKRAKNAPRSEDILDETERKRKLKSWKRILLLVIAISLHNAPEGGAVGVAFGALPEERDMVDGSSGAGEAAAAATADKCEAAGCAPPTGAGMTFASAVNVAVGIGLQNFPEGLAVSLPLRREGCTIFTAFFWGQLSGMVELFSGFIGAYLVQYARVCLPLALAGAAGAMVYVVCSELIPEAHGNGNDRAVNMGVMLGFALMMSMDVALG